METNNRKFTILTFFILAAIFGFVFFRALTQVLEWAKYTNVVTSWFGNYPWKVVGGVISGGVAFVAFIIASVNSKATSFFDEVYAEARKITWPNGQDTYRATLVVSIMVLVSMLMFFVLDNIWRWVFQVLLS